MTLKKTLTDLPIRYKLIAGYFSAFVVAILVGSLIVYHFMRATIETNIENEPKWVVASSSYLEEFYAPLCTIRNLMLGWVCFCPCFLSCPSR